MEEKRRRRTDNEPNDSFAMCPRYDRHELSGDQIEEVAERAAKKAITLAEQQMYASVGKRVVNGIFILFGIVSVGLLVLAVKLGWIKP